MSVRNELNIIMLQLVKLHHNTYGDRKKVMQFDSDLSALLARHFKDLPPNKVNRPDADELCHCGKADCEDCGDGLPITLY